MIQQMMFGPEMDVGADAIERRRKLADALLQQGMSTEPIRHWSQGAARLVQGLSGALERDRLIQAEKANKDAFAALLKDGNFTGAQPGQTAQPTPQTPAPQGGRLPTFAQLNGVNPSLIQSESGGNWRAQNNAVGAGGLPGHFGRLQFGQARLQDAMRAGAIPPGTTPEQFKNDPNLQMAAERWHFGDIDRAIQNGPAASMIGKTINGIPVTQEGLRAVAHLGGVGGMNKFVQTNGAYNPADANGTTLAAYLQRHAGSGAPAPSIQPPSPQAMATAVLGSGMPVNVPPGAPAGTPQITPNNAAPVQPDLSSPGAAPAVSQAQFNVPGVGRVPVTGAPPQFEGPAVPAAPMPAPMPAPAAAAPGGMPPVAPMPNNGANSRQAALVQILTDPRFNDRQKAQAMQLYQVLQKPGAKWTEIGQDEFGRKRMGWVDEQTQTVREASPIAGSGPSPQGIRRGPNGGIVVKTPQGDVEVPQGMDPKTFIEAVTKRAADEASGPKFEDVAKVRNEITSLPSYKNLAQAAPIYKAMFDTAGTDSKASDLNLVYGLGKIMDPTSVVREGEMIMVNKTASVPDWFQGWVNQINGGARLTPETRQAILAEAHNRINSYNQQFNNDAEQYRGIAQRYRMNPLDIIPSFPKFEPWKAPKAQPGAAAPDGAPQSGYKGDRGKPAEAPKPAPAAAPVEGARKAPDGNWYVPDPNRPGKYLKVSP